MDEKDIQEWRAKIEGSLEDGAEAHEELYEAIQKNRLVSFVIGLCLAIAVGFGVWRDSELQITTERLTAIGEATREHYEFQGRLLEQVLTRVEKNTPLLTRILERF